MGVPYLNQPELIKSIPNYSPLMMEKKPYHLLNDNILFLFISLDNNKQDVKSGIAQATQKDTQKIPI